MPLVRIFARLFAAAFLVALSACETASTPNWLQEDVGEIALPVPETATRAQVFRSSPTARPPRELSGSSFDMVLQRVEPDVAREEVFEVVQALVADGRACLYVPAVWISAPPRAGAFVVRYDLMERDWGADSTQAARSRMDELVAAGFLTAEARPDEGDGAVRYDTTREGREYLRGAFSSGQRPAFCAPAGRRLVEITGMDWGQYPCGTLRVRFTHVADDWPHWARHEATRARLAQSWPANGEAGEGEVTLSRQWFARGRLPRGAMNGALISACMDEERERVIGNDLNLTPPA